MKYEPPLYNIIMSSIFSFHSDLKKILFKLLFLLKILTKMIFEIHHLKDILI